MFTFMKAGELHSIAIARSKQLKEIKVELKPMILKLPLTLMISTKQVQDWLV
jgi:hypothetical protein